MIVAVRVRPLNAKEIARDDMDIISVQEKMIVSASQLLISKDCHGQT